MNGHGISSLEQRIMDLFDGGMKQSDICTKLGLRKSYVAEIVGRYHYGALGREIARQEASIRASDLAFQRALAASGGSFA